MDNKILETIKNDQIRMKPRWHFIFKAVLTMVGGLILFFLVIYLISFVIVVEQQSESTFWITLPWFLILLAVIFIAALELFVCRYPFAYRRPLVYSTLAILILIGAGSFAIVNLRFHERFARYAEREHILLAPGFYRIYLPQSIR